MTCNVFGKFPVHSDLWMGCQNWKVLLFINNCSVYLKGAATLRNKFVVFLLMNTIGNLQIFEARITKCANTCARDVSCSGFGRG